MYGIPPDSCAKIAENVVWGIKCRFIKFTSQRKIPPLFSFSFSVFCEYMYT